MNFCRSWRAHSRYAGTPLGWLRAGTALLVCSPRPHALRPALVGAGRRRRDVPLGDAGAGPAVPGGLLGDRGRAGGCGRRLSTQAVYLCRRTKFNPAVPYLPLSLLSALIYSSDTKFSRHVTQLNETPPGSLPPRGAEGPRHTASAVNEPSEVGAAALDVPVLVPRGLGPLVTAILTLAVWRQLLQGGTAGAQ